MSFSLEITDSKKMDNGLKTLFTFKNGRRMNSDLKGLSFRLELNNKATVYLFGEIFYHIRSDGKIKLIGSDSGRYLKNIFSEYSLKDAISSLEGQFIGIYADTAKDRVRLFSDRYARLDSFYSSNAKGFFLSTGLDFIFENVKPVYDQKMLSHLFSVYGWYTPKGYTIYKNVKQLRVGEIITLSGAGMESETIKFEPLNIKEYGEDDLDVYYRILRDSVISRANREGTTWVSSSSGWDSSILLGMLVDEFGPRNVEMISGSMKYSKGTEVINKFEMDKIKHIGNYYGIKPNIVELDFMSSKAPDYWKKVLPYYKSKHNYTYVTYNFTKLSDGISLHGGSGQKIFNGDTSDSFHNFGFSQFATFFHTKKTFTEYADKMNCYLYSPSFFKKVLDGTYEKDKVFQIFKKMMAGVDFSSGYKNMQDLIESYLFPFFYGSPRIPFAKTSNDTALSKKGQEAVHSFPFREYMPEVLSGLDEKNLYSWFIYLYHSFHSQGSTVDIQKDSMEYNGHKWRMPFNDHRMIDFLSMAPESWGRGLELNNTKYPLKWVAKNRIKFPYELLQTGPHSYLYDVIEGFSLFAEITYRSGVTEFFRESVKNKPYHSLLSDKYFNINYLDKIASDFVNGKEASGKDFNNLVSLITLCVTGWY
ncbi:MAG: hypothetical protein C4560_00475 [Nitrospiraceae bacterium]|nr:MAG: hypothetical protein C4560_00475 [Nitrospiraceae bacterium]